MNLAYLGYQLIKRAAGDPFAGSMTTIKPPKPIPPMFDQGPVSAPPSVAMGRMAGSGDPNAPMGGLQGEIQQDQMSQEVQKQVEGQTKEQEKQLDYLRDQLQDAHKHMQAHQSEVARHQQEAQKQRQEADKARAEAHQASLVSARLEEESKLHKAQLAHAEHVHKMTQQLGDRSAEIPHVAQAQVDSFLSKVKGIHSGLAKRATADAGTAAVPPPPAPVATKPEVNVQPAPKPVTPSMQRERLQQVQSQLQPGSYIPPLHEPVKPRSHQDQIEALDKVKSSLAGEHFEGNPYDKTGLPNTDASNPAYHMMERGLRDAMPNGLKWTANLAKPGDWINRQAEHFVNMDPDYLQNQSSHNPSWMRPVTGPSAWIGDRAMEVLRSPIRGVAKAGEALGRFSEPGADGSRDWNELGSGLANAGTSAFNTALLMRNPAQGLGWGLASEQLAGDNRYDPERKIGVGYQSQADRYKNQQGLADYRAKLQNGSGAVSNWDLSAPWMPQYLQGAGYANPAMMHYDNPGFQQLADFKRQSPSVYGVTSMLAPAVLPHVNYGAFAPQGGGGGNGNSELARLYSTLPLLASGYYGG